MYHTPIIQCERYQTSNYRHKDCTTKEKSTFRKLLIGFYSYVYLNVISFDGVQNFWDYLPSDNDINFVEDEIPVEYKFNYDNPKFLVVISKSGDLPEQCLNLGSIQQMKKVRF